MLILWLLAVRFMVISAQHGGPVQYSAFPASAARSLQFELSAPVKQAVQQRVGQSASPSSPYYSSRGKVLPSVVHIDRLTPGTFPPARLISMSPDSEHAAIIRSWTHHHQEQPAKAPALQFPEYEEERIDLDSSGKIFRAHQIAAINQSTAHISPNHRSKSDTSKPLEQNYLRLYQTVSPNSNPVHHPSVGSAELGAYFGVVSRDASVGNTHGMGQKNYTNLYSDAWNLQGASKESEKAKDEQNDSLSALEFKLAQYNVTLHDAAMSFLLNDRTNLTALFPRMSRWVVDDVNMTHSISIMNRLFRALQSSLIRHSESEPPIFYNSTSDNTIRAVRRTWGRHSESTNIQPVVHQYRAGTDNRFIGKRQSCGSGQCEFFMMCWMSGGVVQGGCGGFLFGCCQRYQRDAKSFTPIPTPDYGPVQNDEGCGLSDTSRIGISRRIVGGTQAGFGTFPWQAYILIGTSRCGGSLVSKQHVVTAGHCVARARSGQITVTLGDYVLNSNREPLPAYKFRVSDIDVHPNFRFTPQADRYDVAVLRLDRAVPYVPHIQPICIPDKGTDFEGYYGWAAGWGALRPGSRLRPKELQVVDVPIISGHLCEMWHRQKGINVVIHEEMMCAGYINGGKDSCQGDSGGPLMMELEGRWYLMGIVSAGYSCAQGKQPGIYHRVPTTSEWISHVINN